MKNIQKWFKNVGAVKFFGRSIKIYTANKIMKKISKKNFKNVGVAVLGGLCGC